MAIDVDTGILRNTANAMKQINARLHDKLNESKREVERLKSYYEGEAAEEAFASYDAFANKYFQRYEDAIAKYIEFLNTTAEKYEEREGAIKILADKLK